MLAKSQFTEAAIGMSLGYFLCDVVVIARNWAEVRQCSPSPSWFLTPPINGGCSAQSILVWVQAEAICSCRAAVASPAG